MRSSVCKKIWSRVSCHLIRSLPVAWATRSRTTGTALFQVVGGHQGVGIVLLPLAHHLVRVGGKKAFKMSDCRFDPAIGQGHDRTVVQIIRLPGIGQLIDGQKGLFRLGKLAGVRVNLGQVDPGIHEIRG